MDRLHLHKIRGKNLLKQQQKVESKLVKQNLSRKSRFNSNRNIGIQENESINDGCDDDHELKDHKLKKGNISESQDHQNNKQPKRQKNIKLWQEERKLQKEKENKKPKPPFKFSNVNHNNWLPVESLPRMSTRSSSIKPSKTNEKSLTVKSDAVKEPVVEKWKDPSLSVTERLEFWKEEKRRRKEAEAKKTHSNLNKAKPKNPMPRQTIKPNNKKNSASFAAKDETSNGTNRPAPLKALPHDATSQCGATNKPAPMKALLHDATSKYGATNKPAPLKALPHSVTSQRGPSFVPDNFEFDFKLSHSPISATPIPHVSKRFMFSPAAPSSLMRRTSTPLTMTTEPVSNLAKSLDKSCTRTIKTPRRSIRRSISLHNSFLETAANDSGEGPTSSLHFTDGKKIPNSSKKTPRHTLPILPSMPLSGMGSRKRATLCDDEDLRVSIKKPNRKSYALAGLSPQEAINVLRNSPMVEIERGPSKKRKLDGLVNQITFDDKDLPHDESLFIKDASFTAEPSTDDQVNEEPNLDGSIHVTSEGEHNVIYYRVLVMREQQRLNKLADDWEKYVEENVEIMTSEVEGQIRTVVGQARLLIAQRFKQFIGLVDDCTNQTGVKPVTCTDLQGFWEMIYFQVEDVNNKFKEVEQLKENNWKIELPVTQLKKVVKKKRTVAKRPAVAGGGAVSKFAAFRQQQMLKQKQSQKMNDNHVDLQDIVKPSDVKIQAQSSIAKSSPVPLPSCSIDNSAIKQSPLIVHSTKMQTPKSGRRTRRSSAVQSMDIDDAINQVKTPRNRRSLRRSLRLSSKKSTEAEKKEHDVAYFRSLLRTETLRLEELAAVWEQIGDDCSAEISQEVEGQIRTVVGQIRLLIAQRFKQFLGLVDDCEYKRGEKETTCTDLQGFWEMIYYQVEDVNKKVSQLKELKDNNWQEKEVVVVKKRNIVKKKVKPVSKKSGPSKFAAFKKQMMQQKKENAAEQVSEGCSEGKHSSKRNTSVRRSLRLSQSSDDTSVKCVTNETPLINDLFIAPETYSPMQVTCSLSATKSKPQCTDVDMGPKLKKCLANSFANSPEPSTSERRGSGQARRKSGRLSFKNIIDEPKVCTTPGPRGCMSGLRSYSKRRSVHFAEQLSTPKGGNRGALIDDGNEKSFQRLPATPINRPAYAFNTDKSPATLMSELSMEDNINRRVSLLYTPLPRRKSALAIPETLNESHDLIHFTPVVNRKQSRRSLSKEPFVNTPRRRSTRHSLL